MTPPSLSYILNHLGEDRATYKNAVAPPLFQNSNFCFETVSEMRQALTNEKENPFYTRGCNPTVQTLRKKLAALEQADDALVFGSGCAAIAAAVMSCVQLNSHVVSVSKPYSWTYKLFTQLLVKYGVTTSFVDGTKVENIAAAITPNTSLIYLESPNSMTFELQDLAAVAYLAKSKNIPTICDNSYSTGLNQSPIALGIDMSVHSGTKYYAGHSDLVAGVLVGSQVKINTIFANEYMTLGGILSPHDAWLMLRSLRTLPLRLDKSTDTAHKVIKYLNNHPKVAAVIYPHHTSFAQYELAQKQMKQAGGLFSIRLNTQNRCDVEAFCDGLRYFLLACSWGGYESLVFPAAALDVSQNYNKNTLGIDLVRLYVGLEEADVLIEDLRQALDNIKT